MRQKSLEKEAADCRLLARKFAGRPEEPFLFKLANALEEVAAMESRKAAQPGTDGRSHARSAASPPRWLQTASRS